jgi:hypothetical protein
MKKIGEYTCKGQVASGVTERIILFDGRFDTGYRVTSFTIVAADIASADDSYGTLFSDEAGSGTNVWNWQSNGQIAWASTNAGTKMVMYAFSRVDPDNLIVQDLFVRGIEANDAAVNYMITMEKYEFSEWRGALAMVRNNSQAV